MAKLTCFGGVGSVTGANFLLEIKDKKVLVDCGLLQEENPNYDPKKFDYDPQSVDILFITHAHIDHIGRVPLLVKNGFKGKIYSTEETRAISELMLLDMAKVSGLYGPSDVSACYAHWESIKYHDLKDMGGFNVLALNAGHILGSAMYKFSDTDTNILFTGDLGNSPSLLLPDTDQVSDIEYMVTESVYGDRNHETPEHRDDKFRQAIEDTLANKRTLLIPIFSLERTQVILYELNELFEKKKVERMPVFLDSPLAIRVTEIYERLTKNMNANVQSEMKRDDIFKFNNLKETASVREAGEILGTPGPKIILAGSGMSTSGRIVGHEEKYLPDPNAAILFVGYQAAGTLGRRIAEGDKTVGVDGKMIDVRAKVWKIEGFSAHKDSDHLVEFVKNTKKTLKKVFVTMGEPRASIFLAQRLHDELEIEALVPERGKTYELR